MSVTSTTGCIKFYKPCSTTLSPISTVRHIPRAIITVFGTKYLYNHKIAFAISS